VDPPWGQRHGSHILVQRQFRKWALEWIRVLKPGGILGIISITTRHIDRELVDLASDFRGLIAPFGSSESEQFEKGKGSVVMINCGYDMCKIWMHRKL
jgi:ubiquinone/menaquinone biosynthesis C-methylase UbiE